MPVERLYREIRALRIYEGASEVQQLIIGRDLLKGVAMSFDLLQPAHWPRPKGYANGVAARGTPGLRRRHDRLGRAGTCSTATTSCRRCARRCRTSSRCWPRPAARPEHIVRMTWYVTDKREYLARGREIGAAFRETHRRLQRGDDARCR